MKRKILALVVCICLFTLAISGCASSTAAATAAATTAAATTAATTAAPAATTVAETTAAQVATDLYGSDPEVTKDKLAGKKIVYLVPSKDILYWQWVEDGVYQVAKELGVEVVSLDAQNSATKQQSNVETALSSDVAGIVLSPVSSTSSTNVLNAAAELNIPVTFAAIGPDTGVTNYAACITADDFTSGYENGLFLCNQVKKLGGGTIGVLSLPLDRTNAKNKMAGLEKACKEQGIEIAQVLQTTDLTVNVAVQQANDLITTHKDLKGIYGMYEQAGLGAVTAVESSKLQGKISIVSSDGSPESIAYIRQGKMDGIVVQEAVGQGVVATRQLFRAMLGLPVTNKDIPLPEPLVTTDNVDKAEIQDILKLVYPSSAGSY